MVETQGQLSTCPHAVPAHQRVVEGVEDRADEERLGVDAGKAAAMLGEEREERAARLDHEADGARVRHEFVDLRVR